MIRFEKKDQKERWKELANFWQQIGPPNRPSQRALNIYEKFIKIVAKKGHFLTLLLGATPELRDILAKYNCSVFIFEINHEMVKAMNQLTLIKNKNKEYQIISNWLIPAFKENSFDLVIGDHPISSIPYNLFSKLFEGLSKVMKKNGYFLSKLMALDSYPQKKKVKNLVQYYLNNPHLFRNTLNKWSEIYTIGEIYNRKRKQYLYGIYNKKLQEQLNKKVIRTKDYEVLHNELGNFNETAPLKKDLDKILLRNFRIIKIVHDQKHPVFRHEYIYFCSPCYL